MKCTKCNVVLDETNWSQSRKNTNNKICRVCDSKRTIEWGRRHPERIRQHAKKYYHAHPDEFKERARIWRQKNPKVYNKKTSHKRHKETYEQNRVRLMESWAKNRGLGYVPLNECFEGADSHHIDKEHVVYIPLYIHRLIGHHHKDAESMDTINLWALFWLLYGEVEDTLMNIPVWVFGADTTDIEVTEFEMEIEKPVITKTMEKTQKTLDTYSILPTQKI